MIKKINFLLVLLLLLVSIGAVSAVDDLNDTISSDDGTVLEEVASEDVVASDSEDIVSANSHTVNKSNYYNYFDASTGELKDSSASEGDTINLEGDFSNLKFVFKKSINVIGKENVRLSNCMFTFSDGASGSSISKVNIFNTKETTYGIFLNGVSYCTIQDCFINNTGASSYAVCIANSANYNNVTNNNLNTYGITYGHGTRSTPPLLISGAHYNYIANNLIDCDDANAIYLSSYSGGPLKGGNSNFNLIYNNTVKYHVLPTSWSYGIQLMGEYNTVDSNRIIGAYRGVSSQGSGNRIINNWIINLTGADYNHPTIEVGGDIGIVGGTYSTIANNTILNSRILSSGAGISVLDHSTVENNIVQIAYRGTGIHPQGSDIIIKNNNISTLSGVGILYNSYSYNLTVIGNNITSQSGVGVLIQKLSSKRMPGNITIVNNYIFTGNTYAIDARDADANSVNVIGPNNIPKNGGKVLTPEGEYDPSVPVYNFNGTTYTVTPSNLNTTFLEDNGAFKSDIKDGDILNFEGEFHNLRILVNRGVKINGQNAIFYNTTFQVSSDGAWLENLVIRNNDAGGSNCWGVVAYRVFGATIKNCDIEVCDLNSAYAVYVVESSNVDVLNNRLFSSGSYLTYTLLAHTVEDCNFINNTIKTEGTGNLYVLSGGETCIDGNCIDGNCLDGNCLDGNCLDGNCLDGNCLDGSCLDGSCFDGNHYVTGIFRTYGILMIYASGNNVSGNRVNVTSKLNRTVGTNQSTNSLVGIDLYYNSHDNTFSSNNVYVCGNDNYIYGMGVLGYTEGHNAPEGQGATNTRFINNQILLEGTYFVEGFVIGQESTDTLITSNVVNMQSDCVAYGINLENPQNSTINKNTFVINSDVVYGIESFNSNNNKISENNFEINAKLAYGFALANSVNNEIVKNKIIANGTGEAISFNNHDVISEGNAGIYLDSNSTNNNIKNNEITSKKGYAILLDEDAINNVIEDNYLDSELGIGDDGVNNASNNVVRNNYKYLVNGSLQDININYLENGTFVFTTTDAALEGATVKFMDLDGNIIGEAIIANGEAKSEYSFVDYTPASYTFSAIVNKKYFRLTEFSALLSVEDGDLDVVLYNTTGAMYRNAEFMAVIKNILGIGVEGITVEFYINDDGDEVYEGKAISDVNGIASLIREIPKIYDDYPIITAKIINPDYFKSTSANANLTVYKLVSTTLTVNKNVYPGGVLAILKYEKDNLLSNKLVSVKIGSKTYDISTNSKGEIIMPVISKGSYSVSVSFAGDAQYYDSKNTAKITVLPSIVESRSYTVYYGNTITYKVRVKGSDGSYGAGNVVTIKVNGQTYKVQTDKNGYATKALKLKAGTYTITAEFNGDKVSNKLTFKPTLTAKNIVAKKAKKIKFSVKVVDKNGKAVKKKKVTFKIKGKKYTAKTNKKGVATASIKNLKVGKYSISSSFGGCTIKNTIKIKK
ncbi:right-handed parallel beta-helix repeat-containing protein [Methanobrevibacter sp.]|uniref:right-handed parallel beta-helix repeat-containing protein n=1 Tax=Methanobrevibacter sp. TaxID=66852 RepID=UPI003868E8DF